MHLLENERKAIIEVISGKLEDEVQVYIYGSRSRGLSSEESDIDILILTQSPVPNKTLRQIKIDISDLLGGTKIDIVHSTFDNKTTFINLIEEQAILIWERKNT